MKESSVMARYQCPDCGYVYDEENGAVRFKGKRRDLWKVFFASFAGELAAIPLTLLLLLKSRRYHNEQKISR